MFVAWMLAQAANAPAPTSLQARFEAASAAFVAQKWDDALTAFQAIAADPAVSSRTRGVALLRGGTALRHLHRDDEARDAYRRGLALTLKSDPALKEDRVDALLAVGGLERGTYDYAAARRDFEEALAEAGDDTDRLRALFALAVVAMFDDNKAALDAMDQARRLSRRSARFARETRCSCGCPDL
jgi:tetratricopeptide (TPR) repeat protein